MMQWIEICIWYRYQCRCISFIFACISVHFRNEFACLSCLSGLLLYSSFSFGLWTHEPHVNMWNIRSCDVTTLRRVLLSCIDLFHEPGQICTSFNSIFCEKYFIIVKKIIIMLTCLTIVKRLIILLCCVWAVIAISDKIQVDRSNPDFRKLVLYRGIILYDHLSN